MRRKLSSENLFQDVAPTKGQSWGQRVFRAPLESQFSVTRRWSTQTHEGEGCVPKSGGGGCAQEGSDPLGTFL